MKFLHKVIGKMILGVVQYLWDIQMQPYRMQCKGSLLAYNAAEGKAKLYNSAAVFLYMIIKIQNT